MKINQIQTIVLVFALILFNACNPKVTRNIQSNLPPLDFKQDVVVIELNQQKPENAEVLGVLKIGDSGFTTNCDYALVLDMAKTEARKVGGNAIKIEEHKLPGFSSTCHRIKASVLKIANIESFVPKQEEEVILDVDYAIVNVYRSSGVGALVNYDLHLSDSVICRVKNNFKTTLHIRKDGLNSIWARTESKAIIPVDLKMGKTYYIRCGIAMGAFVGRPTLELVDRKIGEAEFQTIKTK